MTYRPSPPTQLIPQPQHVPGTMPVSQPVQLPPSSQPQLGGPSPVGPPQGPPVGYPTQGQLLSPQQPMPPQGYQQPSYPVTSLQPQQQQQQQQQQHQPQIVYQPPVEQQQQQSNPPQGYTQTVPVMYQPAVTGTIPTSLGSQQEAPRPASPGNQGMGPPMVATQPQLINYSPAAMMAAQQRVQQAQAPQLVPGGPYPQAVPAPGPGPTPPIHPQMLQYPGQRRPFGLDQRAIKGREYYGPPDTGYSSPGTSPSQSPGPPFIRSGPQERGKGNY